MKKLFLSFLSVAVIAGSVFAFAGCNSKDYTSDIDDLQAQIQELQNKIDSLESSPSTLIGSPKFNYSIDETIPYYVDNIKLFDIKISSVQYDTSDSVTLAYYVITPASTFDINAETDLRATSYNISTKQLIDARTTSTAFRYFSDSNKQQNIILFYHDYPFACVTATPTPYVPPTT